MQVRMSPEQRNTIYRLVQAYGEARAARSGQAKLAPRFERAGQSSTRALRSRPTLFSKVLSFS
jgi:hypothetical protein